MVKHPSLVRRIVIGKTIGFLVGLMGFLSLPLFYPDATEMFRWGVLFWYVTLGAFIGVFGVIDYHPILKIPLPWWFRSSFLGAWMNFVLVLFAYHQMQEMLIYMFGETSIWTSPFWFVLEGAIVGLWIGYLATRLAGEGKETVT